MIWIDGEGLVELVMIKSEPAFQAARDFGMRALPTAPLGERQQRRQSVALRQFFEEQVRQRRGGLANGETRMFAALDQGDRASQSPRDHRDERTGKAGADHRDVEAGVHSAWKRRLARVLRGRDIRPAFRRAALWAGD